MKRTVELAADMVTLARLHAALDSVVDTEQLLGQIRESSALPPPALVKVGQLVAEARELLRWLLAPQGARQAVGHPITRRQPGSR
jgi:hypothetical protein